MVLKRIKERRDVSSLEKTKNKIEKQKGFIRKRDHV
jgi:hypothetical protein